MIIYLYILYIIIYYILMEHHLSTLIGRLVLAPVARRVQHGDVQVPDGGAIVRLLAPDVLLRPVAQPSAPEEAALDHEHDGELLLLPQVGARHSQRLVRHVHHGDEHVHQ